MNDDDEQLVDLSVSRTSDEGSHHHLVTLDRGSCDDRWGFLLYNNRFPLTIGRVENPGIEHLLCKGDVIVAINHVVIDSFEGATVAMRNAQLQLVLTIDRSTRSCGGPQPKTAGNGSGAPAAAAVAAASPQTPVALSASETPVRGTVGTVTGSTRSMSPFQDGTPVLRAAPIVLAPSRSNVDAVLCHLPKPPRHAVYSRHSCPLGDREGFTDAFHDFVQAFLTEQALAAGAPNNDLRYDAISAVLKSGIARLPNELVKDITQRGSEFVKKQEAAQSGTYEKERFMTQTNSMASVVLTKRRARDEALEAMHTEAVARKAAARLALQTYQQLCSDADDSVFLSGGGPSTSSSHHHHQQGGSHHHHHQATTTGRHKQQQHVHHGPAASSTSGILDLPVPPQHAAQGQHSTMHQLQRAMSQVFMLPMPPDEMDDHDGEGGGGAHHHNPPSSGGAMSRKQRKRQRNTPSALDLQLPPPAQDHQRATAAPAYASSAANDLPVPPRYPQPPPHVLARHHHTDN